MFIVEKLDFELSDFGNLLHARGLNREDILRTPRAVDSMNVLFKKITSSDQDRNLLKTFRRGLKGFD